MDVWVFLVEVDYESHDIFLSEFLSNKIVHILGPFFYVFMALDMSVVGTLFEVDDLVTEGQFVHLVS